MSNDLSGLTDWEVARAGSAKGGGVGFSRGRQMRSRVLKCLLAATWVMCAVTTLIIGLVNVEVVCITGPVILLCGIAIAVAAVGMDRLAILLGAAHMGVCVLFVLLVLMTGWGPRAASVPFCIMGAGHTVLSSLPTWCVLQRILVPADPSRCENCGYLLYGLTQPRCPECGRSFDPALMTQTPKESVVVGHSSRCSGT